MADKWKSRTTSCDTNAVTLGSSAILDIPNRIRNFPPLPHGRFGLEGRCMMGQILVTPSFAVVENNISQNRSVITP